MIHIPEWIEKLLDHHQSMMMGDGDVPTLHGDSPIRTLKHIGPYLADQIALRGGGSTVGSFVRYVIGRRSKTRWRTHQRLTQCLQNRERGARVEVRVSALRITRHRKVVNDFNIPAYISVLCLLNLLCEMEPRQIRRLRMPTVPADCVPPYPDATAPSALYCPAHCDHEEECRQASGHCRWAVGASGATNCVPRNRRTKGMPAVGGSTGQKLLGGDPGLARRGHYVAGWRRGESTPIELLE